MNLTRDHVNQHKYIQNGRYGSFYFYIKENGNLEISSCTVYVLVWF